MVRHGSAKAAFVGSIPTLASNSKLHYCNELQIPEEASASEIETPAVLADYSRRTWPELERAGFAARFV